MAKERRVRKRVRGREDERRKREWRGNEGMREEQ